MRLAVVAVGAARGPEKTLVDDYAARIRRAGPSIGFRDFETIEVDASRRAERQRRRAEEGERLMAAAGGTTSPILLDERGARVDSLAFAERLAAWRDEGRRGATFLIGGADGHGPEIRAATQAAGGESVSLGALTWPHLLARIMLCEQIYRAVSILSGHPYPRA
ncbi:MAG: 23S rRNA (pseudouridine(1915)-N(3))-methyltransferase RlmH [Parvularculaceae bacterium]